MATSQPKRLATEQENDGISHERQLWASVIHQAIDDATGNLGELAPRERDIYRSQARTWLTKPSRDLREVCDLAGLEMGAVIRFATNAIEKSDAQPKRRKRGGRKGRLITFRGETLSVSEWAHRIGISNAALAKRFKEDWSIEKALTTPARKQRSEQNKLIEGNRHMLTFDGETLHVTAWAKRLGISASALTHRLNKHGWSIEEALTTSKTRGKPLTYNGRTQTLSAWANEIGITFYGLWKRLHEHGWPIERALTTPAPGGGSQLPSDTKGPVDPNLPEIEFLKRKPRNAGYQH